MPFLICRFLAVTQVGASFEYSLEGQSGGQPKENQDSTLVLQVPLTLNPQPPTPNPQPSTLNPQPSTPNPKFYTPNPKPQIPNPRPQPLDPEP